MDYPEITASIRALTHGETDAVALMALLAEIFGLAEVFAAAE